MDITELERSGWRRGRVTGALEAAGENYRFWAWEAHRDICGMEEDVAGLTGWAGKVTHFTVTCSPQHEDFCSTPLWAWQTPTRAF